MGFIYFQVTGDSSHPPLDPPPGAVLESRSTRPATYTHRFPETIKETTGWHVSQESVCNDRSAL